MRLPREENWHDEQVACNMLIIVCVYVRLYVWRGIHYFHYDVKLRNIIIVKYKKNVCEERAKDQMAIFAFAEDWSDKIVSSHCNINNNKWSFASSTVLAMNISYQSCNIIMNIETTISILSWTWYNILKFNHSHRKNFWRQVEIWFLSKCLNHMSNFSRKTFIQHSQTWNWVSLVCRTMVTAMIQPSINPEGI